MLQLNSNAAAKQPNVVSRYIAEGFYVSHAAGKENPLISMANGLC